MSTTGNAKMRIIVSAFETKVLDSLVKDILKIGEKLNAELKGPIPLPTKIKKWTVNRSTFVYEQSKEQFEMRVHRRLIDFINPSKEVVDALQNLNIPEGVNINVKMINK